MKKYLRLFAGPVFVLCMLVGALWLLHEELREYHLRDFLDSLASIPPQRLWLAVGLTVLNFVILIGYDLLGIRYIRHPMRFGRVALASFLGYAVGNNFGTVLGGSTIRYRLYTAWGLSPVEIVKLVLILSVTFWIGLFAVAGVVFLIDPLPIPARLHLPLATTFPLGVVLVLLALAYPVLCALHRTPLKIKHWEFSPPPVGLALLQFLVAALDLMVAASVLYVLLPASLETGYFHFMAIFLLALIAAFLAQVPGGLGVLEVVIIVLLSPSQPHLVMGSLLAYRLVYYLLPLTLGLFVLAANEVALHREHIGKLVALLGGWTRFVAPWLLAVTVFLAGAILLFSGATPAAQDRIQILRKVLPLPVIEISHLLGSMAGILLLLLARGLQRRIETAYYAAVALLSGGILFSLLKGADYEEAVMLGLMLIVFLPCRRHFYRKGALLTDRFSAGWFAVIAVVIACTVWLTVFAYKNVEYRDELWWRFAFNANAPRSLRAMAGIALVALVVATARLLRSRPKLPDVPTADELEAARKVVENSRRTAVNLALLGDKHFLFNADHTAFIMYGVEGRSWVSLGDPVGTDDQARDLAWEFRELCDEGARWPVFYEVDERYVAMYVEMGLTLIKLGEAARVPLPSFSLDGGARRGLRRNHKQLTEEGCTFEIVEPDLDDALLAELNDISDAWLSEKNTAEKGFSLGFFQPDYIRRCPAALVRHQGRIVAFANVLRGADREELSVDLMRHLPAAPDGVMEFLFIKLMLWGREQGYQWFNLGMTPLAGVVSPPLAPLWNRFAALAYRHGEHFYNFQGLRKYKDKFDPVWTPKYLASPGGLALPVILTNVATLISGGFSELVRK